MPLEPSLDNLARATGRQPDELAHMLVCTACTPSSPCDANPALIRAALAAYRGVGPAPVPGRSPEQHVRIDRRGNAEVGDVDEFRRIRAEHARSAAVGAPDLLKDPRKKA